MKKKKGSIAFLLTMIMLLTLCSCGHSGETEAGSTAASQTMSEPEHVKAEDMTQPAEADGETEQPGDSHDRQALLQSLNGDCRRTVPLSPN